MGQQITNLERADWWVIWRMEKSSEVDKWNLDRFLVAQNHGDPARFEDAIKELNGCHKRSHWIWYVFPQPSGMGSTANSRKCGISSIEEAEAYAQHPILRERLQESFEALRDCDSTSAAAILGGDVDELKLHSCLTLFCFAGYLGGLPDELLTKFFDKLGHRKTLEWIAANRQTAAEALSTDQILHVQTEPWVSLQSRRNGDVLLNLS